MRILCFVAALFFLIAWAGHISRKDMAGAFECAGLVWLSVWAATKSDGAI